MKLETQRVKLRKLKISDADFLLRQAKDKEITKYSYVIPPPFRLEKAKEFIKKTHREIRKKTSYEFGIEFKKSKELIGTIVLSDINYRNKNADVGFWLSKKYWGKGLAKESLDLILNFGFKKLKLERIQARILDKNTRSQELLKNFGFTYEGRLRKKTFFKNRWYDDLIYGLLEEEYQK